ncbi:MAG TPA: OmpA family protein [Gemmatimonadales bacterium]|nr:OmpA family protein [Gemmatimonadales bacterium]
MPSRRLRQILLAAGSLLAPAALAHRPAAAQTVFELEGGGSSLLGGYGATASFWRNNMDGWLGIGYLNGLRVGASVRKALKGDTLRVGNDAIVVRFPTDVFSPGSNLLVQGASYAGSGRRTSYFAFAGASSSGLGAPSFQATDVEQPMGALFLQHRVSPTVRLTGSAIVAARQTVMPGVQWQPHPDLTAALVAGVGSDRPYAASSLLLRRGALNAQAAYAWNPSRFRRAAVPSPTQTEIDRQNLSLTYDVGPDFQIGASHQNFVQDSADSKPAARATGNSLFAAGRWERFRLTAGVYDSRSQGLHNLSSYFAVGRELSSWLDAEVYLLQSRPDGRPVATTPIANLRWRVSPRVGVMQQVSFNQGRPTLQLGASLRTGIGEFGADYQIVHQPFEPLNPFRSTLNLSARLQLGSYSTSLGTYIQPDGSVDYAASGSTFLYAGGFGGVQPGRVGNGAIGRYVVRGTVRDETGAPVEGAALDIGGEIAFTNSRGEFFLRARRPQRYPLAVKLDEFLLPGRWEVATAPADVRADNEDRALPAEIMLRRVVPPPVAPAPAPAPLPDPEPEADTLRRVLPAEPVSPTITVPPPLFADTASVVVLQDVRFETGLAVMRGTSLPRLDSIADYLLASPDLRVEIRGHTDSVGRYQRNLTLSQARADVVRMYLNLRGVALERMVARGFGPDIPVASNRTEAGRARNRRVELKQLAPPAPADDASARPPNEKAPSN